MGSPTAAERAKWIFENNKIELTPDDQKLLERSIAHAIEISVNGERSACQMIALMYGGNDAESIGEEIGKRSFETQT